MIGLSQDIEDSINIVLQGLKYDVDLNEIDPEKMTRAMKSKIESFQEAKILLTEWVSSSNRPSDAKIEKYAELLVKAGDVSITKLRTALRKKIDFSELDSAKHGTATKAKTTILRAIRDINSAVLELRLQIIEKNIKFKDENFKIGYAEKYANGDFYPASKYHKEWYDKDNDAVMICPKGSKGITITLDDLNITLPKQPAKSRIKFNKLKKEDQYWRREPLPEGLNKDTIDNFKEYILEQFRLRREGIWFMNNGEPVYLTGAFWFALQWGKMLDNGGYMDFKYAQLEISYHMEACAIDTRSLGQFFLKSRRTGFTYMVIFLRLLNRSTSIKNGRLGMMSKSEDDVLEVFKKFSYAFLELPFFFQPVVKGKMDSINGLFFGKPSNTTKEAKLAKDTSSKEYLNTEIDHRPTKNDSYDSAKLDDFLGDEYSKLLRPTDCIEHFGTIKPTMMPSGRVVGKAWIGSTVGALDKGGENFRTLDNMSKASERSELTGNTSSGLYSYFLPAHKNQEICTDKYGKCWEKTPPEGTLDMQGGEIKFGSIEFLKDKAEEARKKSDVALNNFYRSEPMTREHAYRDKSDDCQFNINKLYEQIDHNDSLNEKQLYVTGNFAWENGIRDSKVIFHPNDKGRFKLAWLPSMVDDTQGLINNVVEKGNKVYPLNEFGYLASDPFSVRSAVGGKGSSGSVHGFCSVAIGNLQKNDCFLEYLCRPKTEDIFFEDVVMAMHFYGIKILPELNRVDLCRYIRNRGYRPFVVNRLDRPYNRLTAHEKEYGGQQMSGVSILADHLSAINSYVENHVGVAGPNNPYRPEGEIGRFPFNETLADWKIFDPDKRTKHDASISSGLGIMVINKDKYIPKKKKVKEVDISAIFPTYKI